MAERTSSRRFGANAWVVEELYDDYLSDPETVSGPWREFFSGYQPNEERKEPDGQLPEGAKPLRGPASAIAKNMISSLSVPTATSIRVVPAKLLEVNRRIVNNQLARTRGGKLSFTHLIGWAVVRGLGRVPAMTSSYHEAGGKAFARRPAHLNLGLAVDIERDGGRTLLVPNIKQADSLDFLAFYRAYDEVVRRVRDHKLDPDMFAGTTATLTNPGTIGTVGSVPRLMPGQSVIVGVGAIDYPAEFQGADPRRLADMGVGKVITLTSTYDHRVIQGAESGEFLKVIHELLLGEYDFYDEIFTSLRMPYAPVRWHRDEHAGSGEDEDRMAKQVAVGRLSNAYRVRGHLLANLNPLAHRYTPLHPELDLHTYGLTIWDLDREFATGGLGGTERMDLKGILGVLRDAYCRMVGVEYMHIQEPAQKQWIQERVEGASIQLKGDEQRHILERLNAAEAFERFLHTKYLGHKRFSLEGAEAVIPMLDGLLNAAGDEYGITRAVMGMAHRGRLNVLANILGKTPREIFAEFEGELDPDSVQGSGDVQYHLGKKGTHRTPEGISIAVELASNPSHLEAVDPVVVGMARAALDELPEEDRRRGAVLPVLIHGDAAFAGQGVVAETLALSQLRGYQTRGTVHLIINNQLGFTTAPHQYRSGEYASDVAKMVQAPIFHVNGDDPEACVRVMRLALDFRQRFAKDVVVDMVCYRRWGHNETDEPSFTQPIMYRAIEDRPSVRTLYTRELVNRGDLSPEEAEEALSDFRDQLERALKETRDSAPPTPPKARQPEIIGVLPPVETGVDREVLDRVLATVTSSPEGFRPHPKLSKMLERRRDQLAEDVVDWATGELLAFGSLLLEGVPVRLAGQDSRRGTFSQRHSVLVNFDTGEEHVPLAGLAPDQAPFMIYDSPLSEFAALGFEYGYSVANTGALVCWEAQFGDFVNGAQVVIDQFVVAAEDKWRQHSGLVMLLPHGYEGQGAEHSSARLERFLTLCAEDNIQVTQPTTAAQYFHLLRRQMHREVRKPLVVMTPKSLLRAGTAASPATAFVSGTFREVLPDPGNPASARRVLLCSGKIAYDLLARRDEVGALAAIVRVEQLYPWPQAQIREQLDRYPHAEEVTWVQDEPENMGAWAFAHGRLLRLLGQSGPRLRHVSRFQSGSPATGRKTIHEQERAQLLDEALGGL